MAMEYVVYGVVGLILLLMEEVQLLVEDNLHLQNYPLTLVIALSILLVRMGKRKSLLQLTLMIILLKPLGF